MGNSELVHLLLKVMGLSLGLMAVIMLCCVVTPYLAKFIDKHRPPRPPRPEQTGEGSDIRGPFEASHEDYDLNYKIYNKDIYGVDFKHGKEKNG